MALAETVERHEISDMIEFNGDKQIRKKVLQSKGAVCEIVCYLPGQSTVLHQHPMQDEIFYVIDGSGWITFEDQDDIPVKRSSIVFVPAGVVHGVDAPGPDNLVLMFTKGPGVTGKAAKGFMLGEAPAPGG